MIMIKFNIECAFSKESESRQLKIVPQLENQSSGTEKSQDETRLNGISAELKDLKLIQKKTSDDILKAQEVLNLQLRVNSKELNQVALSTQRCLKIIEQIAIDSTKIREHLKTFRLDETRHPLGESAKENGEHSNEINLGKYEDNQIVDIKRLKEPDLETKVNRSGVCEKGTQSDSKLFSSEVLNTLLNKRDKEDIKDNNTDVLEPQKSQKDGVVKCSYCDKSHLKTNSKEQASEESETNVGKINRKKCKSSLPPSGAHTSNTWPLNRNSSYDFKNANEVTEKSANVKIKSLPENEGRARQSEISRSNGTAALECSEDTQAPVELLEKTDNCINMQEMEVTLSLPEGNQSSFSDKMLVDETKCKVCKSTSCNLNKPLSGKYSPSTSFKFSQRNQLDTSAKGVGANQRPWSNKCHQSSSHMSDKCRNLFSFAKNTQPSPLNVSNDLYKRHLKNCTVHGCVSPQRPVAGFKGKSCLCEQFSGSEYAKVNNGFSCHQNSEMKTEEEGVTISKLRDTNFGENEVCKNACFNKSSFGTKNGEVRVTDDKTVQSNPKTTSEVDSFKNIPRFKGDENNNKPSTGIFSTTKRKVLALAQEAKRNKEYKFMWFRGGKVFMKKEENSPIVTISNLLDLNHL